MSARYLVLESATDAGSVAVIVEGNVVAALDFAARDPVTGARSEMLGRAVQQVLTAAGTTAHDLAGVICDAGPGSFTSLRCAAAIAKGICAAVDVPLYAVSSLELLALSAPRLNPGPYIAALEAGRGEWFASGFYVLGTGAISMIATKVVGDAPLRANAAANFTPLVGRGLDIDAVPRAIAVARVLERIVDNGPLAIDSWEPDYGRLAEAQVRWEAQHGRPLVG